MVFNLYLAALTWLYDVLLIANNSSYVPVCGSSVVAYGWTLSAHTHLSIPLILQFVIGFTVTGVFNICNTLIVDVHP